MCLRRLVAKLLRKKAAPQRQINGDSQDGEIVITITLSKVADRMTLYSRKSASFCAIGLDRAQKIVDNA